MSIHWPIILRTLRSPFREAVVDDQRSYKAIEILVAAFHVAAVLQARSASRTVGVLLPTSGAFPIAALAGWMSGKVVVPLNYLLKKEELQYVVNDCECDTIITAGAMLDYLGDNAPDGRRVGFLRMDELDFKSMPDVRWPASAADDDLGVLLYTSGTSGRPKGVMLTHGNITANIAQIREFARFSERDILLGVLPQFHSFGLTVLTLMPLVAGCKVVYTARFLPAKLVRLMRQHRPTAFIAIPSMYNALLHAKDIGPSDLASFRFIISGGEPLPRAVADAYRERLDAIINEGYGLTETAPVTNVCLREVFRPGSVGPCMPGVHERIVDIVTGEDLPPGQDGEVRIAGPNVMRGYYKLPAETAAAFDERGYLRTGDMGRLDADGHLYITGRLKEMIIIGGENVFPREIEEVLNRHPSVKDSGVVGIMDEVRGELPVAFVEMKEDAEGKKAPFDERSILAWCRQHLAGYKVPRDVRELDALPRNPTGKVMRRELKQML
jgi:long-chain acyl-CoA synthetase